MPDCRMFNDRLLPVGRISVVKLATVFGTLAAVSGIADQEPINCISLNSANSVFASCSLEFILSLSSVQDKRY